ncbi:MAG: YbaK/EbsC family protein [Patescibacteria group bacterium]|jgi:prolyl-tRNA editing enzyme YbaK/EbsC (Cys-tRNA(Pro) deacylase)
MKEHLDFQPIKDHSELVSESVYRAAADSPGVLVGQIDPQYMNGVALADHYDVSLEDGANCIVVRGKRGETITTAAVLVPVGYRADLNGLVCELLDAKTVSMAPLEEVIQETGMEYGSITPVGLPESWKILIDSRLMEKETIIVGGGKQISKLRVSTAFLKHLPNVEVVENLANKVAEA